MTREAIRVAQVSKDKDEKWILDKFSYRVLDQDKISENLLEHKDYLSEDDFSKSDLTFYKIPPVEKLKEKNILGQHFFSYYHKWTPQENFYYCTEHTGYKPNPERSEGTYSKYASLDDKMDGMHFYMRYIKFGLGRCADEAAHEIRDGHITRQEGLPLMNKYDGEFPKKYFKDFLNYTGISEKEFFDTIEEFRPHDLWKKENGKWVLRKAVWHEDEKNNQCEKSG